MTDNIIKVLGTGTSESTDRFNNSFIIKNWQGSLLIDCDQEINKALSNQNISTERVDAIFITKIDTNSLLGLDVIARESLAKNKKKITLYFHKNIYQEILNQTVQAQLDIEKEYILNDYFNIQIIEGSEFTCFKNNFSIFEVFDDYKKHSFGFNMDEKLFYSGTSKAIPNIINNNNFIIGIHDVNINNNLKEIRGEYHDKIKNKLWLTSFNSENESNRLDVNEDFKGLLREGQEFKI